MAAQQVIEHVAEAAVKAARYPHMMSKLTLKNGTTLRNRVIMGSMHTGLEEAKGGRLEKMVILWVGPWLSSELGRGGERFRGELGAGKLV